METVAAAAGVSTATISRFFSAPDKLRPDTAARVQEVVNRLGYVPNLLAGGLSSARTGMIAAVIPTVSNSIFSSTIQAISDSLATHGYSIVLGLSGNNDQFAERQVLSIIGRRPDGIILTGTTMNAGVRAKLRASNIPTIELTQRGVFLLSKYCQGIRGRNAFVSSIDTHPQEAVAVLPI